jgi:hypothetical protein
MIVSVKQKDNTEWEIIFANNISDKRLVSKIQGTHTITKR